MTAAPADTKPAAGVSPWWRTATAALLFGLAGLVAYDRLHRPPPPAPPTTSDPRLDRVLDAVDYDRAPLDGVLADLGRRAGITVVARWDQLAPAHMSADTPVTVHLRQPTFAAALDAVLRAATPPLDSLPQAEDDLPTWDERADVILVGTVGKLPATLGEPVSRVYDLRPLLAAATAAGGSVHVGQVPTTTLSTGSAAVMDVEDEIRKYLEDTIRPATWRDNGGTIGTTDLWAGFMVVQQSERCQRDVAAALRSMRGGR